jgi:hypothetical protein
MSSDHHGNEEDTQDKDKMKTKQRARVPIFESAMKDNKFFT